MIGCPEAPAGTWGHSSLQEDEIYRNVVSAIQSVVGVTRPITAETNILQDLNLDSVAVMDFIMQVETQFDTVIPMNQMAEIETVGDLVRILNAAKVA
jgi:acyl carrier protein